jgi:hypothetical protein
MSTFLILALLILLVFLQGVLRFRHRTTGIPALKRLLAFELAGFLTVVAYFGANYFRIYFEHGPNYLADVLLLRRPNVDSVDWHLAAGTYAFFTLILGGFFIAWIARLMGVPPDDAPQPKDALLADLVKRDSERDGRRHHTKSLGGD